MIGVPQKLFLAGATGQLGSRLLAELMRLGQRCVVLTRRPERIPAAWDKALDQQGEKFIEVVVGDPLVPGDWQKHLETATGVVNLCGENIFAKRWSRSFKELLRTSRLISTSNIRQSLVEAKNPCPVVNASGIGFYGGWVPRMWMSLPLGGRFSRPFAWIGNGKYLGPLCRGKGRLP